MNDEENNDGEKGCDDETCQSEPKAPSTKARVITKSVLGGVASIGAGYVIQHLARKYIPTADMKVYQKALVKVGVYAISTAAVAVVTREVNAEIDDFYDEVDKGFAQYNEAKKEAN